ncbi:TIGR01244 family sulfur transferase [Gilvimarinus sp. F26214L]|uniref:TIGR01244 family sulfur transferase n=1 Tax=Gilvimarinus sp. DZF01 TaxID=3461371 RepID=UPI00404579D0
MPEFKIVVPDQLVVGGQVQPKQVAELARQGFKTLISNRPDQEEADQPGSEQVRRAAEAQGMDYVHIPVSAESISHSDVEAFHLAMSDKGKPVFAHCGSGRRSFLLWAAGQALFEDASVQDLMEQAQRLGIDASVLPQIIEQVGGNE